jgi:hypothetical protein
MCSYRQDVSDKNIGKNNAVSTTIRIDEAVEPMQLFNKFIYAGHMLVK